ncbi:MAG: LysR family transcriptional regulator [Thermotaleaceae bacterium]
MPNREFLYIKTIAEEKSISKAAQKLFLTQPSLSKCVQKIESSLGTKLFKRTNTGLILTFAGERYCQIAADIMKIYNDFEIEVSDINNLKKGKIILGLTRYLATYLLPVILPMFKQECPNISVNIIEENSTELERLLSVGKLDFAIMHTLPFHEISKHSNIDFYPLSQDPFLIAVKPGHPLGQYAVKYEDLPYPQIDITLLAKEPFIMVERNQRIRQVTDMIFQKSDIDPTVVLTTKSYETARRLAFSGIGATLVPQLYSQIFKSANQPDYYCIDKKYSPYWTMCIAIQKNTYISKAAKLFIRIISEAFGLDALDL